MGGHGSGFTREKRLVNRQLGIKRNQGVIPADSYVIPNHSGDHSAGSTGTPVNDLDIANKKYVDEFGGWTDDGTVVRLTTSTDKVGIGTASPNGTLDVHTGDAGAVTPSTNADDLVIESDDNVGISILSTNTKISRIFFGAPADPTGAKIQWSNTDNLFHLGSSKASGEVGINSGNDVEAIRIDSNQNTTFAGEIHAAANTIDFTQQSATGDGTTTIDWKLGNKFKFTFGAQNDTFTFTAPTNPCNILLMLVQDGTGSRLATWPATVKWPSGTAPTLSTGAAAIDIMSFYFDGTNYFGVDSLDFS